MASKDSIRVSLELFEGPLDLLLHLIREQQIDIASIPISQITSHYLEAIDLMHEMDLDIAGEYLVMAATLILIKSRILLPPSSSNIDIDDDGMDPGELLIARLRQYQMFREAGHYMKTLYEHNTDRHRRQHSLDEEQEYTDWVIEAGILDLMRALKDLVLRSDADPVHLVTPSTVTIRERINYLLTSLKERGPMLLAEIFLACKSRNEAVVTFMAMLEMIRMQVLLARQKEAFGEIRLALTS